MVGSAQPQKSDVPRHPVLCVQPDDIVKDIFNNERIINKSSYMRQLTQGIPLLKKKDINYVSERSFDKLEGCYGVR